MTKDLKPKNLAAIEKLPHWKVGDGMKLKPAELKPGDDPQGFVIGNIAVVQLDSREFLICYADTKGIIRGSQSVSLIGPM